MEEKLKGSASHTETMEAGALPAHSQSAAEASQSSMMRSNEERNLKTDLALDLNKLQESSGEELEALARDLEVYLHPARSRNQHILDILRAALAGGGTVTAEGFLDQVGESFAMLRWPKLNFLPVPEDVCVSRALVEQHHLRPGQKIAGTVQLPGQRGKFLSLDKVTRIEGHAAEEWTEATDFDKLTPQFPQGRIILENPKTNSITARAVDLLAPLGRGQRGLIVAPPRVGKTILLKEIAKAIRVNHPDIVLILLLVDERPEEVTDLEREVDCQIYHSNFDESVQRHVQVAEMVMERAKRLVEMKQPRHGRQFAAPRADCARRRPNPWHDPAHGRPRLPVRARRRRADRARRRARDAARGAGRRPVGRPVVGAAAGRGPGRDRRCAPRLLPRRRAGRDDRLVPGDVRGLRAAGDRAGRGGTASCAGRSSWPPRRGRR